MKSPDHYQAGSMAMGFSQQGMATHFILLLRYAELLQEVLLLHRKPVELARIWYHSDTTRKFLIPDISTRRKHQGDIQVRHEKTS